MTTYMIIVSLILILTTFFILVYYGFVLKNSKYHLFLHTPFISLFIKKIVFAVIAFLLISLIIFSLTESMTKTYLSSENNESFISRLLDFFHNILPIPKKVCSTTYLKENTIACSNYEYKLIDLGYSSKYMKNVSVYSILKEKCKISFTIGIIAYFFQCIIGYPLGVLMAKHENKAFDKSLNFLHIVIRIIPPVIYFYLFSLLFMLAFKLPVLFDVSNKTTYIAPLVAITINSSLYIAYFVRKYTLLELNKDYVKFARSKGLSENRILFKHVLRNSMIPLIRTIPSSILMCFCGFYLLEVSFNIPGIGQTLIYAIKIQDVNLIRGLLLFFSTLSITAFLLGDLLTDFFKRKKDFVKEDK